MRQYFPSFLKQFVHVIDWPIGNSYRCTHIVCTLVYSMVIKENFMH